MEKRFLTMLLLSLWAGIFILLLRVFLPVLRQRYTARWRCLVWMLLTVRLLIPFTLQLPQALLWPDTPQSAVIQEEAVYQLADADLQQIPIPLPVPMDSPLNSIFTIRLASQIWLGGMTVFATAQICAYLRLRRQIWRWRSPASARVQACWEKVSHELAVQHLPPLFLCPAIGTPMLVGALRPNLLLPHEDYSEDQLRCIFRHELIHLRRGHLWCKLAILLANCVHWFNPAIYLLADEANKDIELACDEETILGFSDNERAIYGSSIIGALPRQRRKDLMFTTNFGGAKEAIKLRLAALFDEKTKRRGRLGFCGILILVVALGITLPNQTTAAPQKDNMLIQTTELPIQQLPHQVDFTGITSANRIQLGPYVLTSGVNYTLTASWTEGGDETLHCVGINADTTPNGIRQTYTITSGKPLQFTVPKDGYYYTEIPQSRPHTDVQSYFVRNDNSSGAVIINAVELLRYDDSSPYLHSSVTNHSGRNIKEYQQGMMTFDQSGQPLQMFWNPFSDGPKSHYFLYDWGEQDIPAGITDDTPGGWSIDDAQHKRNGTTSIAYALYCFKEITFDDGTTWKNPDFQKWLDTYRNQAIDPQRLDQYYPYSTMISE